MDSTGGAIMSQYITTSNPPTYCGVESCMNDAYVTIFVPDHAWIGICPACLDELHRLQSGVKMPEQRGNVTVLHYDHKMPGLRFTASIEAGESEEQP
jgi:hypothetical protein